MESRIVSIALALMAPVSAPAAPEKRPSCGAPAERRQNRRSAAAVRRREASEDAEVARRSVVARRAVVEGDRVRMHLFPLKGHGRAAFSVGTSSVERGNAS